MKHEVLTFANVLSNSGDATSGRLLKLLLSKQDVVLQHSATACAVHLALLLVAFHFRTTTVGALACHHNVTKTTNQLSRKELHTKHGNCRQQTLPLILYDMLQVTNKQLRPTSSLTCPGA